MKIVRYALCVGVLALSTAAQARSATPPADHVPSASAYDSTYDYQALVSPRAMGRRSLAPTANSADGSMCGFTIVAICR